MKIHQIAGLLLAALIPLGLLASVTVRSIAPYELTFEPHVLTPKGIYEPLHLGTNRKGYAMEIEEEEGRIRIFEKTTDIDGQTVFLPRAETVSPSSGQILLLILPDSVGLPSVALWAIDDSRKNFPVNTARFINIYRETLYVRLGTKQEPVPLGAYLDFAYKPEEEGYFLEIAAAESGDQRPHLLYKKLIPVPPNLRLSLLAIQQPDIDGSPRFTLRFLPEQ